MKTKEKGQRITRRGFLKTAAVGGAVATTLGGSLFAKHASSADVIQWSRLQDLYAAGKPIPPWPATGTSVFSIGWVDWVQKATNGRLVAKRHEPGALVAAGEALKATGAGMVDGLCMGYGGYWSGIIPEADIEVGLPMAWSNSSEYFYAYYRMGLLKEIRDVYAKHNIYYFAPFCLNAQYYNLGTTFPINSIKDLKGKKIRALGVYGDFVKALGGTPVVVAPNEMYMALKLGTIDGVIFGASGLEEYKLKEVLKYYVVTPCLNAIVPCILINMDKWKALPQDIKEILERDTPGLLMSFGADFYMQQNLIVTNAQREYGLKAVTWSDQDIETVTDVCVKELWQKIAAKSPNCKRLVDMVISQSKHFGKIK